MTVYCVTNTDGFVRYYFERKEDAENWMRQFTAADGMRLEPVTVITHEKYKERDKC